MSKEIPIEQYPESWKPFVREEGRSGIFVDVSVKTHQGQTDSIARLVVALARAQADFPVLTKDRHAQIEGRSGGSFGYNYADLATCLQVLRPTLNKHGLAVIQRVESGANMAVVATMLAHESGEWIESTCSMPYHGNEPRSVASAITYARRYGFLALVGAAPAEDDDDAADATKDKGAEKKARATRKDALIADIKSQTKVDLKTGEELPDTTLAKDCPKGAAIVVRYQYENGWHHGWLSLPDAEGQVKAHEVKTKRDLGLQLDAAYQSQKPVVARWNDKGLLTALDWYVPAINGPIPEREPDDVPF